MRAVHETFQVAFNCWTFTSIAASTFAASFSFCFDVDLWPFDFATICRTSLMFFDFSAFSEYLSADLASPSASHSYFFFFAFKSSSSSIRDFLFIEKAFFSFFFFSSSKYNMYFCLAVAAEHIISLVIFTFREPFTALI